NALASALGINGSRSRNTPPAATGGGVATLTRAEATTDVSTALRSVKTRPEAATGMSTALQSVKTRPEATTDTSAAVQSVKTMPGDIRDRVNAARAKDDATLQWIAGPSERAIIQASVLLISGCQDNQLSMDGARNGLFTEKLKQVWNSGAFTG